MKRFLATLFFAVIAVSSWAFEVEIDGIYYDINDYHTEATVIKNSNYSGDLVIPGTITYNNEVVKVTSIGKEAFRYCFNLTSVTFGKYVTSIGDEAFYECSSLTSLTIPNSVKNIGKSAFCNCTGLTSVTIPNSVKSIGNWAFEYCSKLTSVTIPNSVTSLGEGTFVGCNSLSSVVVDTNNPNYCSEDNFIYTKDGTTLVYCMTSKKGEVTIPNTVTSIGNYAFCQCTGLASVTIPNSVISIGDDAFGGCTGLTSVTIGNSVTSIGDYAFKGCSSLTSIIIPNSVTYIGGYAFMYCSGLTSVTIGNSVTSITKGTFWGCSGLKSIVIPNHVMSIGGNAFYWCSSLTSVTIPNSVTNIEQGAFENCSDLTSVTIGNSVKSIDYWAFRGCKNLAEVTCTATTVPSTASDAFESSYINSAKLIVPKESFDAYKSTAPWSSFGTILPMRSEYPSPDSLLANLVVPGRLGDTYYDHLANDYCSKAFKRLVRFSEEGVAEVVTMTKDLIEKYRGLYNDPLATNEQLESCLDSCILYEETLAYVDERMTGCNNGGYVLETNVESKGNGKVSIYEFDYPAIKDTTLCAYSIYSKEYVSLGLDLIAARLGGNLGLYDDDSGICFNLYPDEGYKVGKVLVNNQPYEPQDSQIYIGSDYKQSVYVEFIPDESSGGSETQKCEKPTITYENKHLIYSTTTEGAEIVSEVTCADIRKSYDNDVELTATYNITAYATKAGMEDSDIATATLVWATGTLETEGINEIKSYSIEALPLLILQDNGLVTVSGLNDGDIITVYSANGAEITKAQASGSSALLNLSVLQGKVAILSVNGKNAKVMIR